MPAPQSILDLVERFERNRDSYLGDNYNEARLRREFLDPFFEALGWDMDNAQGYAEAYKDVIHEDAIKIGSATKAPDYCFRIGGTRKFFLEAKKPSVDIKDDPIPAYQLRRYAWSAKLPLSILSDFQELAVYDCRIRPAQSDKSSTARVKYYTYGDYAEKWDEIAAIFSREAVLKGSFDKFADSAKLKKGTAQVDDAFLAEIESWRDDLAHTVALRNPNLDGRELNFAVQVTIDRIIFLRICEDRGIERYGELQGLLNGDDVYQRLLVLFRKADDRYNSGLFHFNREKDRPDAPDELTPKLSIDDKILKDIFKRLYYPDSPYAFSVLPAEILGQVYEQFLGKVITLTAGHRAKVEEKPEVKKAGGVFYTPSYIVDYIVQNTVGKLVEGKTPKEVEKITILDPACGSGSFLLGAYQFLLDWHLKWYLEHSPEKWARGKNPPICVTQELKNPGTHEHKNKGVACSGDDTTPPRRCATLPLEKGECCKTDSSAAPRNDGTRGWVGYKLTRDCRKQILLNNLFGVDIDSQAVEVTKLSLLLKVLEGEKELNLFAKERALPDLEQNIKCGNSLIGPDFYNGHQLTMFDEEQQYKINAFDWKKEFKEIFSRKNSGFDAVIGNPPYIRIQIMKETQPESVDYFSKNYKSASKGNYDIYVIFVEKAIDLLNTEGITGFILPHKFFNAEYGEPLRDILSKGQHLSQIVHFGAHQVFHGATTYTCLLFLGKDKRSTLEFHRIPDLSNWIDSGIAISGSVPAEKIDRMAWNFSVGNGSGLVERLKEMPLKLGGMADIFVGLQTSADDVFIMDWVKEDKKYYHLRSKAQQGIFKLEKALFHPLVSGTDVQGYPKLPERQYILFPYEVEGKSVHLIPLEVIEKKFPKTAAYLLQNKKRLVDREKKKLKGKQWHGYIYLKNMQRQNHIKLCVPRLVDRLCAGFDEDGSHFLDNVDVGGVTLKPHYTDYDLRYLLGLLNCRLLGWFFPYISALFRGGWMSANRQFLSLLPIRVIDFKNKKDKALHDKLVSLVETMLGLHKKLAAVRTPNEKTRIQRQIAATDDQIDRLVYVLYGLTEEEIKLIEESLK